ncbi:replication endonuclease [Neisseriaceae bacterium B1]
MLNHFKPITQIISGSAFVVEKLPAVLRERATGLWLKKANVNKVINGRVRYHDVDGADKAIQAFAAPFVQHDLPLDLDAKDDEIRALGEKLAQRFEEGVYTFGWTLPEMEQQAAKYAVQWQEQFALQLSAYDETHDELWLNAIVARLQDKAWWTRHFRRVLSRRYEHGLRGHLNLVNKRNWLYCSNEAVLRRRAQKRRNAALMQSLVMINELGQEFSLAQLVEKSNANPAIRRAELMTRIAGFEAVARDLRHCGEFITITCPSRFHRAHHISGDENAKYDGSTPRDASAYLNQVWAKIQAALKREEIELYGFRVAEPHHDGCPHWHGLFFMPLEKRMKFREIVARYACRADREELGLRYFDSKKAALAFARTQQAAQKAAGLPVQTLAELSGCLKTEVEFWQSAHWRVFGDKKVRARVDFQKINWNKGTAAGYIAKYIAKNIDGKNNAGEDVGEDFEAANGERMIETAERVDAWASLWGIRQFQQIGGAPVGIWRELRREGMAVGDYNDVIVRAALAADKGDWGKFVAIMGGTAVKRADLPVQLYKETLPETFTNKYGEPLAAFTRGVLDAQSGEIKISRVHEWTLAFQKGGNAAPWTCVNNSTKMKSGDETEGFEVKKRKESVDLRQNRQARYESLVQEIKRLARDEEIEPFFKAQEMVLLNTALGQIAKEPEFNTAQVESMVRMAQVAAFEQQEREDNQRALQQYHAKLNELGRFMQPELRLHEKGGKLRHALKLRKFAAPKQYDSAESVLREAADLLAEIELNFWQ